MQRGVHGRLMDNSTSVREAAVELLGRFVLSRPQLTEQYYDMLIERILVSCPLVAHSCMIILKLLFYKFLDLHLEYFSKYENVNMCSVTEKIDHC